MSDASPSFRAKIFGSAKLTSLKFASDVGLRLLSTVILSRLLAPEVYGVFAVVLIYAYLLEVLSDLGIRSLILTREGEIKEHFLQTCWTISILRGLILLVLSVIVAGVIGYMQTLGIFADDNAYAAPQLPWAIAALGSASLIMAFQSPMYFMSERDMVFTRVTLVQVSVNVIALVTTIALAYYFRSIWALVLGAIAKALFQSLLSFALFPGTKMRLRIDRDDLAIVIDRGKWIMGHSMLTAMATAADRLVLGFVMSSTTFGLYYIARQLADMMALFLNTVDMQISLQVFTHLHKSSAEVFRRNYYRYRLFFDALAGLSTGGLYVLAPLVIAVIFDDRYVGATPILQVLIWGFLLTGPLLLRSAFSAERRFKEMTLLSIVATGTLWVGLFVSVLVFNSIELALITIALYRLPEAMLCILWGGERDWVIVWREFTGFVFCLVGIVLGWGILFLWNVLNLPGY